MNDTVALITAITLGLVVISALARKWVAREKAKAETALANEITEIRAKAEAAFAAGQKLLDEQVARLHEESARIRQHYESEAQRAYAAAEAEFHRRLAELEPLRQFESMRAAGQEIQRILADATEEALGLQAEAQRLLEQAQAEAAQERAQAAEQIKTLRAQMQVALDQAIREAGQIVQAAKTESKRLLGDAASALENKELLEGAVRAMQNVIEGYGDRYLVLTRTLLDELATDFGHTAAGESLRVAREQSRRMVQDGDAADCDYAEPNRRETAIRFVTDAFNGRVEAILTRDGFITS